MRWLLEKSAEYLEKGLQSQRLGDVKSARFHFLKASELLYKAAEDCDSRQRDIRIKQAEEMLHRAQVLSPMAGEKQAKVASREGLSQEASAPEWAIQEKPDVRLADVAGLEAVKEQIRIKMIYPFTHPELAQRYRVKKGGGILLYGPPGTGKTMLAKAVAGEIDAIFYAVKPSEIMSKWVGEAEQNIAKLFAAARSHPRAVIFVDEVEALIPKRRDSGSTVMQRVVPQILSEMEGFGKDRQAEQNTLLFMGATNEPWSLDDAVMRPGRFDDKVYVPLPDREARKQILALNLKGRPLAPGVSLGEVADTLEGYSGADIRYICERATDIPFVESVKTGQARDIEMRDVLSALHDVKPSVTRQMNEKFQKFAAAGT